MVWIKYPMNKIFYPNYGHNMILNQNTVIGTYCVFIKKKNTHNIVEPIALWFPSESKISIQIK